MSGDGGAVTLRTELRPGDLGMITHLHGVVYAAEYGLDRTFEPYVARPLSDFVLAEPAAGRIWIAEKGKRILGSIALVRDDDGTGQLRWFLLLPEARGLGLGRRMLRAVLDHAAELKLQSVHLWTFAELDAAIKIYREAGFAETERTAHMIWGALRTEIRMELKISNLV